MRVWNKSGERFTSPVRVKTPNSSFIVSTAWKAVEYLQRWQATRGSECRTALVPFLDALRYASLSFVTAVRAAGLLV